MSTYETDTLKRRYPGPIAYLMPEFPGQTHVWFWREVSHLREWGVDARLFSTRPPDEGTSARHEFAQEARAQTTYLLPRPALSILRAVVWGLRRPRHFARAASVPFTLDRMSIRERGATLALLVPACIFARETELQRIRHVHVHSAARSTAIALMARRLTGIPYSLTLHGNLDWWGGGIGSKLANAEFTIVVAQWLLDDLLREYPQIPSSSLVVASMGVDTSVWQPAPKHSHDSTFRLVSVGRLAYGKGHDVTLRAVARLRQARRVVDLSIIGSGPDLALFESLTRELGLERSVSFLGSLSEEDVITHLQRADAFVLASRVEPRGVAYMEAMALALPTVGTDVGGVAETITDGYDGILVPSEDDERLAAAVERLMDDPELRRRLGTNGRRTVVERFDSRVVAATLFERMFGTRPPRAGRDGG